MKIPNKIMLFGYVLCLPIVTGCWTTSRMENNVPVKVRKYQPNYLGINIQNGLDISMYDRIRPIEFTVLNNWAGEIGEDQKIYNFKTVAEMAQFGIKKSTSDITYAISTQLLRLTPRFAGNELNNPKPPYHPDHFTRYWLHGGTTRLEKAEQKNYKYYTIKLISKKDDWVRDNPVGKECYLFMFFDQKDQLVVYIAAMK